MITLLCGDNDYEIAQAIAMLKAGFDGDAETIDGATVTSEQLHEVATGATLFASKRLVIVKGLSEQKSEWAELVKLLEKVPDETHLVLVEPTVDKRSKTYKWLQKNADVKEYKKYTDRDRKKVEHWVTQEAKRRALALTQKHAEQLVRRVGVDQWRLHDALEKLALVDSITEESIQLHIQQHVQENVFELLETALRGDREGVQRMIETLRRHDDAYRVFGLLSSQMLQLAALALSGKSAREVAGEIKASEYVLGKFTSYAERLTQTTVRSMVATFAESDMLMKQTNSDPWIAVERCLLLVAEQ